MTRLSAPIIGLWLVCSLLPGVNARAEWNPAGGAWGKDVPTDVRVMTFNILDNICRTANKTNASLGLSWQALARIVAAIKPDVLILQEAGDNSGNGTGTGVDTVAQLETTLQLFLHGGTDPFNGGTVQCYVDLYLQPGDDWYDLPYLYVSDRTDNYNRNVVLSRFPFGDLNGDSSDRRSDIHFLLPDAYAPGFSGGGIRGFMFVELNLSDTLFAGDLVVGNAHLKAGSTTSDHNDRIVAAKNVAYYIDYLFNGAGTGVPDPNNKISTSPEVTSILADHTPVVIGGDWNEDEQFSQSTYGEKGPAAWLTQALAAGGTDGTDRNRTDSVYDNALDPVSGSRGTRGGSKLDYIAWQDSIATPRRAFVFNTQGWGGNTMYLPPEFIGFSPTPFLISSYASDHRPVVVDLILPRLPGFDLDGDGDVDEDDLAAFTDCLSGPLATPAPPAPLTAMDCLAVFDADGDEDVDSGDFAAFQAAYTGS